MVKTYEGKLSEFGIPVEELGFDPLVPANIWKSDFWLFYLKELGIWFEFQKNAIVIYIFLWLFQIVSN